MTFTFVTPETLPDHWAFVQPGLEKILEKNPDWWTPADVKARLLNGFAFLHVAAQGFVILERSNQPNGTPYMNIWHMWFKPGAGVKLKKELVEWLDMMRRMMRCEFVQFGTAREEWAHMIEGDFEKAITIYRRRYV